MQDFLGLDDSARMNKPSSVNGNWIWRMNKSDLTDELAEKIRELTYIYRRC
jgi:4-alpha-glucanotransferase